jgi:hypothetical protein
MKLRITFLSLLTILCLILAVIQAAAGRILYENGPVDDDTDAWIINRGYVVSDTFTLTADSTIEGRQFAQELERDAANRKPTDTISVSRWYI